MVKECAVCEITSNDKPLYEGLLKSEIVFVCEDCAQEDGIPLIKKPTSEQLQRADERYSVRERMEKMSGRGEPIKKELITQHGFNKLRMPKPKETNSEVLDNYYWILSMARRRKKLTFKQLEQLSSIPIEVLESIERGRLPQDFREIFLTLEKVLGIKLLKYHDPKMHYTPISEDGEKRNMFKEVYEKMKNKPSKEEKKETINKIEKGELDFSRKENIKEVTLNDLIELKREKEKEKIRQRIKEQTEDLFGEDLELDD